MAECVPLAFEVYLGSFRGRPFDVSWDLVCARGTVRADEPNRLWNLLVAHSLARRKSIEGFQFESS